MNVDQYHRAIKHEAQEQSKRSKKSEPASGAPLLGVQAEKWLNQIQNRKRNPVRPATINTYRTQLNAHILPKLKKFPVDVVGNKVVKDFVSLLSKKKLSPNTIQLNINIIKQIRASVMDDEGAQKYPYTWNSEVIDSPIPDKKTLKTPVASSGAIQAGLLCQSASEATKTLLAVLAGTGMRIQEALALTVGPDDGKSTIWLADESKIIVRQQRDKKEFGPTKTSAGEREIDLHSSLNNYLKSLPWIHTMFPRSEGHYRRELIECGVIGGFHSLRRFRVTHIRLNNVPEPLVHFWIGHEDETVTDRYTKVGAEIEARKQHAERVGLGFQLPEVL